MLRLVIGLGNPGSRYLNTRHNVGFMVLERWARERELRFTSEDRGPGDICRDGDLWLCKPQTFMNESGGAVRAWAEWLKVVPAEILVVVDDVALELGQLRLRSEGSHGGHNGLRSVEAELGATGYARLRCGVGPLPAAWSLEGFVLAPFAVEERDQVQAMTARAVEAIRSCQEQGIQVAMNAFNQKVKEES